MHNLEILRGGEINRSLMERRLTEMLCIEMMDSPMYESPIGLPEGEGVGTDGGEENGWHVGVDHGATCSNRVGCAAGRRGQHDTICLDLFTKPPCQCPDEVSSSSFAAPGKAKMRWPIHLITGWPGHKKRVGCNSHHPSLSLVLSRWKI